MPKVSVYLPDDLYARARELELPLSAITQEALEHRIAALSAAGWVERQMARPSRRLKQTVTAEDLMAAVDEEFGA